MHYGRHFTLLNDHKPLLAVFGSKKGIPAYTANRPQRWATLPLGYDFKIKYQSTTSLGQADALSRLIGSSRPEPEDTVIATIALEPEVNHVVSEAVRILPVTADMVRQATDQDPVLQQVIKYHRNQWPRTCQKDELKPYFNRRDALSLADGCLLFSERAVIPKKLQPAVLNQFHKGHPGTHRMKALARSYVYWPLMDPQIEQVSKCCLRCAEASKSPVKTYLRSWPQPTEPWSRLHIDYAGPVGDQHFLVVVEAYSKWPEIFPVNSPTTAITVLELRRLFSRFGTPETIVSDNGSQNTSSAFAHFCREYGITHIRSPPFYPQSNSQAERFVDTLKRTLQKSRGEGPTEETLQRFLLAYRATPNPNSPDGVSPAEALLRRRLRTPHDTIRPKTKQTGHRNTSMEEQSSRHHGATARAFSEGQKVLVRDYSGRRPTWTSGLILRRPSKVLYEIQVGPAKWMRQANQIRPTDAPILPTGPSDMSLEMLLDTFDLGNIPESQSVASSEAQPEHRLQPRRWTDKIRKPVRPLQVNPRHRSYVNKLQGGGVKQESTRIPLYRTSLDAATAEKPGPREVGPEFGTLVGPASRRDLIDQQSGPNSQS